MKLEKKYTNQIGINNGEIAEGFICRVSDFTRVNTINALLLPQHYLVQSQCTWL